MTTLRNFPRRSRLRRVGFAALATCSAVAGLTLFAGRSEAAITPNKSLDDNTELPSGPCVGGTATFAKFDVTVSGAVVTLTPVSAPGVVVVASSPAANEFSIDSVTRNGLATQVVEIDLAVGEARPVWEMGNPITVTSPLVLDVGAPASTVTGLSICLQAVVPVKLRASMTGSGSLSTSVVVSCRFPNGLGGSFNAAQPIVLDAITTVDVDLPVAWVGAPCSVTWPDAPGNPSFSLSLPDTVTAEAPGVTFDLVFRVAGRDFSVTKSMSPSFLFDETSATFTIVVRNEGNAISNPGVVVEQMPSVITLVPGSVTASHGTVAWPNWSPGALQPGESATLNFDAEFPLEVGASYPPAPPVVNCAGLAAPDDDPSNSRSCVVLQRIE